jgi:hypothetical protein
MNQYTNTVKTAQNQMEGRINLEYTDIPKVCTSVNEFPPLYDTSQMLMLSDVSHLDL